MKNEIEFRVEWGDTDPAAITFYPNFFRWYDWGTWNLLAAAGLTRDVLNTDYGLIGFPIVEAQSKFHSPTRFWDQVRLTSQVQSWGRKSLCVAHTLHVGDRLSAEGLETRVCARESAKHPGEIESVIVPAEIKRALSGGAVEG